MSDRVPPPDQDAVPAAYAMRRFSIFIAYATMHLTSIDFELGPDELDLSHAAVLRVSEDHLDVLPTVEAAADWGNRLIDSINHTGR